MVWSGPFSCCIEDRHSGSPPVWITVSGKPLCLHRITRAPYPKEPGEWWKHPVWKGYRPLLRRAKRDGDRATRLFLMLASRWNIEDTWRTLARRMGVARSTLCASVSKARYKEYALEALELSDTFGHFTAAEQFAEVRLARNFAGAALDIDRALRFMNMHNVMAEIMGVRRRNLTSFEREMAGHY